MQIPELKFPEYPFSPILGWSISRFEMFDKCKRQYFYQYYSKFVKDVPFYKVAKLKELTSVPLEAGNAVHDCMEALLARLQKSDSKIDEEKFFKFADDKLREYFTKKTFIETYYGQAEKLDIDTAAEKVRVCLENFLGSPCCSWLYMKAMTNKTGWMIEPPGYGETRLDGMKAYCKMDFLFPVGGEVYILDWKTGAKDEAKHSAQLMGYAVAANSNFSIPWNRIFPKIVYLYPQYDELEISFGEQELAGFFQTIRGQTEEMYSYCRDKEQNLPHDISKFIPSPSPGLCRHCKFQELCGL
ncbi:MAG: PD-(D/E)XK nuclease family protein [Chitinispirillales bacterium]|jgi:CRISPR/Cas system-associated exonuclease Cas4 (RecB family)|nr:PD-(D/E)XK nuclease family protein [Chitinispirillales bacterium]